MARPQKPYRTSWGEYVPGLLKLADGRWRIVSTGERFSEEDEFTAGARFKQQNQKRLAVFIPISRGEPFENAAVADTLDPSIGELSQVDHDDDSNEIGHLSVVKTACDAVCRHYFG
jgi:hypothetical protein